MKIFLRHEHPGPKRGHHHDKRGHKLFKKMAKLEKKLGKYHLAESGDESCSSAASEVRSRSRRRHRGGRHQRARFASLGRCSSSSSSDSSSGDSESGSGTSTSSSSDSSRSPSPGPGHHRHHRHHRHHGPPRHLSRSKSFAGRGCGSSPPLGPGHHNRHHHRHQPAHHRDHHHHGHWRRHAPHRHREGICGLLYKALARSEPNLPEAETMLGGENPREEAAREPEVDGTSVQELGNVEASAPRFDETVEGPELGEDLSETLKETLGKGLLADVKKSLLQKYPISKDCLQLRGSKLNQEFLSVASETAVKRDSVLQYEQSQIGTGLTALGRAINELNARAEAEHSTEIIPILDAMGDAASIIADAHHNITQMRQAFLAAELNKRVRPVVDTCKADELLFGKDFADKVKDVRAFGKGKKGCEKKEKRKHADQDGEKRKSKRLHRHGIVH